MGIFDVFRKKDTSAAVSQPQDEDVEEYEVIQFVPRQLTMTSDLLRRRREDEIRKKYCRHFIKTGEMS